MVTSLTGLWMGFGLAAGLLVLLIIYRSIVGNKEDDQLFLNSENPSENRVQAEQQAIVMRVNRLTGYIRVLWIASGVLLLTIAGIWIYRGIVGFNNPG